MRVKTLNSILVINLSENKSDFPRLMQKSDFRRILNQEKTKSGRRKSVFIFSILMILILAHIFSFIKHQNPVLSGLILSCSKFEEKLKIF